MPNDDSISSGRPRAWQRASRPAALSTAGGERTARPGGVPPMFGFDQAMRPRSDVAGHVLGARHIDKGRH